MPNLLIHKLQKLLLGLFNVILGSTNENLVAVTAFWWELDTDPAAFIHDGADESALGSDHGIVMFMWNIYLHLSHIGLQYKAAVVTKAGSLNQFCSTPTNMTMSTSISFLANPMFSGCYVVVSFTQKPFRESPQADHMLTLSVVTARVY